MRLTLTCTVGALTCVALAQKVPPSDSVALNPSDDDLRAAFDIPELQGLQQGEPEAFALPHVFRPDPETCGNGAVLNVPLNQLYLLCRNCLNSLVALIEDVLDDTDPIAEPTEEVRNLAFNARWAFGVRDWRDATFGRPMLRVASRRIKEIAHLLAAFHLDKPFPAACSDKADGEEVFVKTILVARFDSRQPSVLTVSELSICPPALS